MQELRTRCFRFDAELSAWWEDFLQANHNNVYWEDVDSSYSDEPQHVTSFVFPNLRIGPNVLNYWAICVAFGLTLDYLQEVKSKCDLFLRARTPSAFSDDPDEDPESEDLQLNVAFQYLQEMYSPAERDKTSRYVARSVGYFMRYEMGLVGRRSRSSRTRWRITIFPRDPARGETCV